MGLPSKIAQIYNLQFPEPPAPTPAQPGPDIGVGFLDTLLALIPWALLAMLWSVWKVIAIILSILLVFGIIYSRIRAGQFTAAILKKLGDDTHVAVSKIKQVVNKDWERVVALMGSQNENDWKLAIMEADIMLDQMVKSMGYPYDTLGENLQSVEKSDFNTINEAWEAHKVRNKIAHEGSSFILTQRIARETINNYRKVFEEFKLI